MLASHVSGTVMIVIGNDINMDPYKCSKAASDVFAPNLMDETRCSLSQQAADSHPNQSVVSQTNGRPSSCM